MPSGLRTFLRAYEERAVPLNREANLAYWFACTRSSSLPPRPSRSWPAASRRSRACSTAFAPSKIHPGTAPVYYQNYLPGTLTASKLREALTAAGAGLAGGLEAGELLRRRVFEVGMRYPWNEMPSRAKGSPLSAEAFLVEFAP